MPKGQAAVNWTAEEDSKLFLTVLAVHGIQMDYNAVAKEFGKPVHLSQNFLSSDFDLGPDVPGSCIQTRMKALRKKAASLGITPKESPVTGTKRALVSAPNTPSKKAKKTNAKNKEVDEGLDLDVTPPTTSEINTPKSSATKPKARGSPRKNLKKDYKAVSDPFVSMNATDSNGEDVFGIDKSESEDSYDNDEFKGEAIKTEEEVAI